MNPKDDTHHENTQFIPDQLRDYPLIRVCRLGYNVHDDCDNRGKRPIISRHGIDTTDEDTEVWAEITLHSLEIRDDSEGGDGE